MVMQSLWESVYLSPWIRKITMVLMIFFAIRIKRAFSPYLNCKTPKCNERVAIMCRIWVNMKISEWKKNIMIIILWKNSGMQKQHNRHSTLSLCWTNLFAYMNMMELSKQCERCVWKNDDYNRFHFIYVLSPIVTFKDSPLNTFDAAFECLWLMAMRCRPFMFWWK